jgi:hypothetical protein
MVQIEPVKKRQFRDYWWPASKPQPAIAKITVPPGKPKQQVSLA